MSLPTSDLNSVFWLSILGVISAIIGMCLKSCYKSKCSSISCCGLSITRDTDGEVKEDIIEVMKRTDKSAELSREAEDSPGVALAQAKNVILTRV